MTLKWPKRHLMEYLHLVSSCGPVVLNGPIQYPLGDRPRHSVMMSIVITLIGVVVWLPLHPDSQSILKWHLEIWTQGQMSPKMIVAKTMTRTKKTPTVTKKKNC